MSEDLPYDGILFELWSADANAPGGRRRRLAYGVANEPMDVPVSWKVIDRGPHILKVARDLGVQNNQVEIVDG